MDSLYCAAQAVVAIYATCPRDVVHGVPRASGIMHRRDQHGTTQMSGRRRMLVDLTSSLGAIRALTNICRWFPAVLGGSTSVLPESLIDQLVGIL